GILGSGFGSPAQFRGTRAEPHGSKSTQTLSTCGNHHPPEEARKIGICLRPSITRKVSNIPEPKVAKVGVEGSNPFARSIFSPDRRRAAETACTPSWPAFSSAGYG